MPISAKRSRTSGSLNALTMDSLSRASTVFDTAAGAQTPYQAATQVEAMLRTDYDKWGKVIKASGQKAA